MVVMRDDIFEVLLSDLFLFGCGESVEVFDEKFANPDNLSFLNLVWFGYLSKSIEEELLQEGDNLIRWILTVSFLEKKTEK